jgi:DnaK suppressor protein
MAEEPNWDKWLDGDDEPLAEELTDEQVETKHEELLVLRRDITALLEATREGTKPVQLDQARIGRLTRVDAMQQQKMAESHRRRLEMRLQQIKVALEDIEQERYGFCNRCGEPIGIERLDARPESPVCVSCQADMEAGRPL